MNQIKFQQQKRNGTFIEELDMLFYRVYDDGSFDTITVSSIQDGLNRISFCFCYSKSGPIFLNNQLKNGPQ